MGIAGELVAVLFRLHKLMTEVGFSLWGVLKPKRSELQRSEDARIKQFGFRFYPSNTPDKAAYDKAQVGDQLEVRYRYIGNEKEIISIRNLTHADS